jgi:hypothetical protein
MHYRPLEASMIMNAYVLKTIGFSWFARSDQIMNDLRDELHYRGSRAFFGYAVRPG